MTTKLLPSIISVALIAGLAGCGTQSPTSQTSAAGNKPLTIGVTVYGMDSWVSWGEEGMVQMAKHDGAKIEWDSASNNVATQISQMETFINQHVSAIIVDPASSSSLGPQIKQAVQAGIPVFGLNVRFYAHTESKKYVTGYVGPNDVLNGEHDMEAMAKTLHGHGNIVVLQGPIGQSATKDRTNGIETVLKKYPGIHVLAMQPANWSRATAYSVMLDWTSRYNTKINGVVAENDDMAIGAIRAMDQKGLSSVPVVGSDGIADGLKEIMAGREQMTNLQNAPLQMAEDLAVTVNYVKTHKLPQRFIFLTCPVITKSNVQKVYNQIYVDPSHFIDTGLVPLVKYDLKTKQYGNEFLPSVSN